MHIIVVICILVCTDAAMRFIQYLLVSTKSSTPTPDSSLYQRLSEAKKALSDLSGIEYIKKQREIQKLEKETKTEPTLNAPVSFFARIGLAVR